MSEPRKMFYIRTPRYESDQILFRSWLRAFQTILSIDSDLLKELKEQYKKDKSLFLDIEIWAMQEGMKLLRPRGYDVIETFIYLDEPETSVPSESRMNHNKTDPMHQSIAKSFD